MFVDIRHWRGRLGGVLKASVEGMARLNGRKAVISAGDFTVRGGSPALRV